MAASPPEPSPSPLSHTTSGHQPPHHLHIHHHLATATSSPSQPPRHHPHLPAAITTVTTNITTSLSSRYNHHPPSQPNGDTYSVQALSGGVTDWYQSQGYREPGRISRTPVSIFNLEAAVAN
ncbi:hypothetical protein Tco_1274550 [Tanacetum coccineum]